MIASDLAPCVAVVGPANSGKTTLLHLLDDALQRHPAAPLAYVVKGNPDGTGRYLFHAPELREALKPRVKGVWCDSTIATVSQWIESCRRRLDLVLLDAGGKHSPSNASLFRGASHFIVLARRFRSPEREAAEGMGSWSEVCVRSGLTPVATVRSLFRRGRACLSGHQPGLTAPIRGTFRADASAPGDTRNNELIEALVDALLRLSLRRQQPRYLDLRLGRDWQDLDLAGLGGRSTVLDELVASGGPLVLGGRAPIWAYAAALHRSLDVLQDVAVEVFDPKVPSGLVPIPSLFNCAAGPALDGKVAASWSGRRDGCAVLEISITTPDRFLPFSAAQALSSIPLPDGEPPQGPVIVSGAAPIWLHLAYHRWLRSLPNPRAMPGPRPLAAWDARSRRAVFVAGDTVGTSLPLDLPFE